ncbi:MAG: hypothetical protein V4597_09630 [Pseudomonadota bacterium]
MSIRNRVLLLAAAACTLSAPAVAAGYLKLGDIKGEAAVAPQIRPQAAGGAKADILIEAQAARRKAARDAAGRSAASQANQTPDIITGAGAGGHPALLVPAVQKARVAPGDGE